MSNSSKILRSYYGDEPPPAYVQIGLAANGVELTDDAYERAKVERGAWLIRSDTAEVTVRFGPFHRPVQFNESLLIDGETITRTKFPGAISLIAGMEFAHTHVAEMKDA